MINTKWDLVLKEEYQKEYFHKLGTFVKQAYKTKTCYPSYKNIFAAFQATDYDDVKVVILGQDPYHGEGEAQGLSFSVTDDVRRPPSLQNILKELQSDLGIHREKNDLTGWATQGVLLVNAIMTVEKDKPLSHKNQGWEIFTDTVIAALGKREKPIVFVLWGSFARSKKVLISSSKHKIIENVHPSPLSANRGFMGSKPFSQINQFLVSQGQEPIDFSK